VTVKVAIDLALDRLFDYEVPEALEKQLAVGQLLLVPFGHRAARGFAVAIAEAPPSGDYRLKAVSAIADPLPFFSPTVLELCRRLARYYAAPLELMLKAAVPSSVLKPGARARERYFVRVVPEATVPQKMPPRRQWLWEQLRRLDGGWLAHLTEELGTTPATLRQLAAAGLVSIEKVESRRDPLAGRSILPSRPLPLNEEQAEALAAIADDSDRRPLLVFGVTGSGKTEIYLQAIAKELAADRSAIVLVPEISLTPQTVRRFASRFGSAVAVLHSSLSDGERYDEWHRIRRGEARVVIGPRSALFAPVRKLGLIVVDEEHEPSYKQEEAPRYHARDAAVLRAALDGARVVLGSATPSLESWHNAEIGKYRLVTLAHRAGSATPPVVRLVDASERQESAGYIFSPELLEAITRRLDRGEQTIVFLNRRGFSRTVICGDCGETVKCPACDLPYAWHQTDDCLRCHLCGGWAPTPKRCPHCDSQRLTFSGIGTERAVQALSKCFPRARILRMDTDSVARVGSHDEILGKFRRGEADILLGTQMIAKGLDFPNVTLVGVLEAEGSLYLPDFRAAERTYQLLSQVAGRAGRAELPGEVIFQCRDRSLPILSLAAKGDFAGFAKAELMARKEYGYPPFCSFSLVSLRSKDSKEVANWAAMYSTSLQAYARKLEPGELVVGEAVPSVLEKVSGWVRWQITLKARRSAVAVQACRWLMKARPAPATLRLAVDIDARNLL